MEPVHICRALTLKPVSVGCDVEQGDPLYSPGHHENLGQPKLTPLKGRERIWGKKMKVNEPER